MQVHNQIFAQTVGVSNWKSEKKKAPLDSKFQRDLCNVVMTKKPYGRINTRSHVTNATLFGTIHWMNVSTTYICTVIVFGYLNSKNVLGYILMYLGTHLLITKWNLFGVGH